MVGKKFMKKILLLGIIITFISSCALFFSDDKKEKVIEQSSQSLVVNFNLIGDLPTRTLTPDGIDISPSYYILVMNGPEGQLLEYNSIIDSTHEIVGIDAGLWNLEVTACANDNSVLGVGSTDFLIHEASSESVTVNILAVQGSGSLVLNLEVLDSEKLPDPVWSVVLKRGELFNEELTLLQDDVNPQLYTLNYPADSGEYIIDIIASHGNGTFGWGLQEVVYILADRVTTGSWQLSSQMINQAPGAPEDLYVTDLYIDSASIKWTDVTVIESAYLVQRRESGTLDWVDVSELTRNSSSYIDNTVLEGTLYEYRVGASNTWGTEWSTVIEVQVPSLINIEGRMTESQTWTKENFYKITNNVLVPDGIELIIEPGTRVMMGQNPETNTPHFLQVEGTLQILGSPGEYVYIIPEGENNSIQIVSGSNGSFDGSNYTGNIVQYLNLGGAELQVGDISPIINNVTNGTVRIVHNSFNGSLNITNLDNTKLYVSTSDGSYSDISVSNCDMNYLNLNNSGESSIHVYENSIYGQTYIRYSNNIIFNDNTISGNSNNSGISVRETIDSLLIRNNIIENCNYGVYLYDAYDNSESNGLVIEQNTIQKNSYGLYFGSGYYNYFDINNNLLLDNTEYGIYISWGNNYNQISWVGNYFDNPSATYEIYLNPQSTNNEATNYPDGIIMDISGNFWGYAGAEEISSRIYDSSKDFTLAEVVYEPIGLLEGISVEGTKPSDVITLDSSDVVFEWNVVGRATEYGFELAHDDSLSNIIFSTTGLVEKTWVMDSSTASNLSSNGIYYWRVSATDEAGSIYYSPVYSFDLVVPVPLLQSPVHTDILYSDWAPELSWSGSAATVRYELILSNSVDFSNPHVSRDDIIETSHKLESELPGGHTYYWKVRGVDAYGIYSDWSETYSFDIPEPGIFVAVEDNLPESIEWTISGKTSYLRGEPLELSIISEKTPDSVLWYLNGDLIDGIEGLENSLGITNPGNHSITAELIIDNQHYTKSVDILVGRSSWFKYVSTGSSSAIVTSIGEVWTGGNNSDGELGIGTTSENYNYIPYYVDTLNNITDLWKSWRGGTFAINTTGEFYIWGDGYYKVLGQSYSRFPTPQSAYYLENFEKIVSGYYSSMGLNSDGIIYTWGYDNYGLLGNGSDITSNQSYPVELDLDFNTIDIAMTYSTAFILSDSGDIYSFGNYESGLLGFGEINNPLDSPTQITDISNIVDISTGSSHILVLDEYGDLYWWGYNNEMYANIPEKISGVNDITQIATGRNSSFALDSDGNVWAWGYYIGISPSILDIPIPIVEIHASGYLFYGVDEDMNIWVMGKDTTGLLGEEFKTWQSEPQKVNWSFE